MQVKALLAAVASLLLATCAAAQGCLGGRAYSYPGGGGLPYGYGDPSLAGFGGGFAGPQYGGYSGGGFPPWQAGGSPTAAAAFGYPTALGPGQFGYGFAPQPRFPGFARPLEFDVRLRVLPRRPFVSEGLEYAPP
jgi:hypothetical protein